LNQLNILMVSGGVDSMVMLHNYLNLLFMKSVGLKENEVDETTELYKVVYVNHNIRDKSHIEKDILVIRQLLKRFLVMDENILDNFVILEINNEFNEHSEEWAREERYKIVNNYANSILQNNTGINKIIIRTAHHANDQAETLLMKIYRGTGLKGLRGIHREFHVSDNILLLRPFLNITKEFILNYAEIYKLFYNEDVTNKDIRYLRNEFRAKFSLTESDVVRCTNITNNVQLLYDKIVEHMKDDNIFYEDEKIFIKKDYELDDLSFLILSEFLIRYFFYVLDANKWDLILSKDPSTNIINLKKDIIVDKRKKDFIIIRKNEKMLENKKL